MDPKDAGREMTGHLDRTTGKSIIAAQPAVWVNLDHPNLSDCHSCGTHRADLHFLPSKWRLVVLCDGCLSTIKSAGACSYCFSNFGTSDHIASLNCQLCHCQVHPKCILSHHRFGGLPNKNSFTCIDCCPYMTPRPSLLTEKFKSMEQSDRQLQLVANNSQSGVAEFDEQLGRWLQPVPNGSQNLETRSCVAESDKQLGHLLQPAPNCSQSLEINNVVADSDEQFSQLLHLAPDSTQRLLSRLGQQKLKFKKDIIEDWAFFRQIESKMSQEGSHYKKFNNSCKDDVGCVSDLRTKEMCASSLLEVAVIREESQSGKIESSFKDIVGCESDSRPKEISASASGAKQDSYDIQDLQLKKYFRKKWRMKGIVDTEGCSQTRCLEEPESTIECQDRYSQKYSRKPRKLKGMMNQEEFDKAPCTQTSSMGHETFYDKSAFFYVSKLSWRD